jgi:hypothetical protein
MKYASTINFRLENFQIGKSLNYILNKLTEILIENLNSKN